MNKFISCLTIIMSLFLFGCNGANTQPDEISVSTKRTPIKSKDSVKSRVPIYKAIECLNLTREQRLFIDTILIEERECTKQCKKQLHDSIQIIEEQYKQKMEDYRNVEKTDSVRKEIQIISQEFRQLRADVEKEYRDNMKVCNENLYKSIEAILRLDQLTLWNIWKETGKIPCSIIKP